MKFLKFSLALFLLGAFSSCEPIEDPDTTTETDPPSFTINAASDITTSTAFVSGSVSGENIQEVGFAYGTSSPLDENSWRKVLGSDLGDLEGTLTGLSSSTEYFYAVYAENSDGEFFKSNTETFSTQKDLALGDIYEGGIIYSLDFSGKHGLLVSPSDVTAGTTWQSAYDACYAYELQGNANWRMPSLSELEFLYSRKDYAGGFAAIAYWSRSVEGSNPTLAYGVFFGGGANAGESFVYDKTGSYQHSRAIRDF